MALKDKKAARKEAKQRAKAGNVLPDDDQKWEPPEAKKDKKAARKKAKPRAKAGNVLPDDDQKGVTATEWLRLAQVKLDAALAASLAAEEAEQSPSFGEETFANIEAMRSAPAAGEAVEGTERILQSPSAGSGGGQAASSSDHDTVQAPSQFLQAMPGTDRSVETYSKFDRDADDLEAQHVQPGTRAEKKATQKAKPAARPEGHEAANALADMQALACGRDLYLGLSGEKLAATGAAGESLRDLLQRVAVQPGVVSVVNGDGDSFCLLRLNQDRLWSHTIAVGSLRVSTARSTSAECVLREWNTGSVDYNTPIESHWKRVDQGNAETISPCEAQALMRNGSECRLLAVKFVDSSDDERVDVIEPITRTRAVVGHRQNPMRRREEFFDVGDLEPAFSVRSRQILIESREHMRVAAMSVAARRDEHVRRGIAWVAHLRRR
jgi:hypothetical protein